MARAHDDYLASMADEDLRVRSTIEELQAAAEDISENIFRQRPVVTKDEEAPWVDREKI